MGISFHMPTTVRLVRVGAILEEALSREPRLNLNKTLVVDADPSRSFEWLAKAACVTGDPQIFKPNLLSSWDKMPFVGVIGFRVNPRPMDMREFINQRTMLNRRVANLRLTLEALRHRPEWFRGKRVVCINSGVLPKSADSIGHVFFSPQGDGFHATIDFSMGQLEKGDIIFTRSS